MDARLIKRRQAIAVVGSVLLALGTFGTWGCTQPTPDKTVTVEIIGISGDDGHREQLAEDLKSLTDGNFVKSTYYSSEFSGNRMTVHLAPVSDVKAFAKKIDFALIDRSKRSHCKVGIKVELSPQAR